MPYFFDKEDAFKFSLFCGIFKSRSVWNSGSSRPRRWNPWGHWPEGSHTTSTINKVILIVDDEDIIRNLAKNILVREGFEVILAESGQKACDIFEKEKDRIDLVVLDMIMPGIDGKETYKRLHMLSPSVRVVFASGYSKDNPSLAIPDGDKTGFVQKPYNIDMLVGEVRRVMSL